MRPSRVKQIKNCFLKRKIEQSQRGERRQVINDRVHQQEGLSLLSSVKSFKKDWKLGLWSRRTRTWEKLLPGASGQSHLLHREYQGKGWRKVRSFKGKLQFENSFSVNPLLLIFSAYCGAALEWKRINTLQQLTRLFLHLFCNFIPITLWLEWILLTLFYQQGNQGSVVKSRWYINQTKIRTQFCSFCLL